MPPEENNENQVENVIQATPETLADAHKSVDTEHPELDDSGNPKHVEIESEIPPEVGLKDFLKERGKIADEPKVEENKDKLQASTENKDQVVDTTKPIKKSRDYSDIQESDVPLFKSMSNESFEKLKPIYLNHQKQSKEIEELKKKVTEKPAEQKHHPSLYQHKEGYVLTPEYREKASRLNSADQILKHWQKQEISIRRNGKYQDIDFDKSGRLVVGELKDATEEDEVSIQTEIQKAKEQYDGVRDDYKQFIGNFENKRTSDLQVIKDAEDKLFEHFGREDHPTQPVQKEIMKLIPESLQESPLASLLVKTGAANMILKAEIDRLKTELDKVKGIKTDIAKAQPTKNNFVNGGGNNGATTVKSMSDFKAERNRI